MTFRPLLLPAALLCLVAGCSKPPASTMADVRVQAPGMKCESCAETIESTFRHLPGVDSVDADPVTKWVFVRCDTTKTTAATLEETIGRLGFDRLSE